MRQGSNLKQRISSSRPPGFSRFYGGLNPKLDFQVFTSFYQYFYKIIPAGHSRKNAGFAGIFLLLIGIIAISVASVPVRLLRNRQQLITVKKESPRQVISEISSDLLQKSDFSGPFLMVLQREDNSYTYVEVSQAIIRDGRLVGDVIFTYPDGQQGVARGDFNQLPLFITRNGDSR